jgi:tetratricopeptide (TPR) repeat protein
MATNTRAVAFATNPFSGLGETDRRVLSFGAAIGKEFDWSVLITATEMDEEPLAELLERLVHRGILKELNGGDTYAFVRIESFTQAYRDISTSRLRVIHKKVALAYEKLHPNPTPEVIPEIGRHFYLGGVHEKSLLYNRYAARTAMAAFSPDVALFYLERARENLAALPGDHRLETADVLKEMGEQYSAMGDASRADQFYGESLAKLPEEEVTMRGLVLLSRAIAAREMDKLGLLRKYCEDALQLLEKAGHRKGMALAHRTLSAAAYKEGKFEAGWMEIEATLALLDPEKDARDVASCYIGFGNLLSSRPTPEEQARAIEYYRMAIKTLEPLHDYPRLGSAHNNIAVAIGVSNPREALNELKEARTCAERSRNRRFLGWVLFNSVEMHLELGEEMQAAQNNAEARRILSRYDDPSGLQHVAFNDGILAHRRKAFEDSEKAFRESLKRAEDIGYPSLIAEVLIYMAMMYADWGKKDEANRVVSRIREIGEEKVHPSNRLYYENVKKRLSV